MRKLLLSWIAVLALLGQAAASTVTLTWVNTTTRTDGSAITGALTTNVTDVVTVSGQPPVTTQLGAGASPFKTPQLPAGSHAFTIIECEAGGACSAPSNVFTTAITVVAPNAITTLTGTVGP